MTTALDFLKALGVWSLPHLWLPLAAWTLVALAALALLRAWPAAHPLVQYRARQALLLALPLGLLAAAAAADLAAWLQPAESPVFTFTIVVASVPTVEAAPAPAAPDFTWWHALGLGTLAAVAAALLRLGRLLMQAVALARFRRALRAAPDAGVQRLTDRLAAEAGLRRRVRTLLAGGPLVPMTFGGRRPVIVLPAALASDDEDGDGNDERLRMALTHELAHVRRCDYLAHAAEQVAGGLFVFHPLAGHLRRRIAACREQACDAAGLAGGRFSARRYATLLLDLTGAPARPLAVPMTDPSHPLKNRLTAMKKHARRWKKVPAPRRTGPLLGLALLPTAVLVTACADLVSVSEEEAKPSASNQAAGQEVFMVVEDQPELIGGMEALYDEIAYPALARKAGIEGTVFVQFVVNQNGNVADLTVVRGVYPALDAAALDAVRQVRFEPGRLDDGTPVQVKMALPIRFELSEDAGEAPGETSSDV